MQTRITQNDAIEEIKTYLNLVHFNRNIPASYKYSPESFVLAFGAPYYIGEKTFEGKRDQAKMCYRNCFRRMIRDNTLTYVEGYVNALMPIAHAWLIDKAGNVIDPTLQQDYRPEQNRVLGYFGVPLNRDYVINRTIHSKHYGILYGDRNGGLFTGKVKDFLAGVYQPTYKRLGSNEETKETQRRNYGSHLRIWDSGEDQTANEGSERAEVDAVR